MRALVYALAVAATACGGSSDKTPDAPSPDAKTSVKMTGSLQSSMLAVAPISLAGYQLYCVTFASPPMAASGTADATGVVSVTLPPATPFGCFVLDASGA